MREFHPDDLMRFLLALDANLSRSTRLVVIGGAALALGYRVERATLDLDTFCDLKGLEESLQRARADTGLDIPVEFAAIAQAPWNYEDRLVELNLEGARNLHVFVPEAHDLALMKIVRGDAADLGAIEALHQRSTLNPELLVTRFQEEMGHVIGDKRILLSYRQVALPGGIRYQTEQGFRDK